MKPSSRSQGKVKETPQILETLVEETVSKHNLSIKSESVTNHHLETILNPNSTKFKPS